ncbi:MAG: hypothetical protein PHI66_03940 [Candidatus Pacebacteria bacterium]|nr:hypothetical protein [Candidatus Paceibacterota bacterium]
MYNENPWVMPRELEFAEKKENKESNKQKTENVLKIIDQYIPDRPDDYSPISLAEGDGIGISELSDDQKQRALDDRMNYDRGRNDIVEMFSETSVSEEDLPVYISEVMSFEREIADFESNKRTINDVYERIWNIVVNSDSTERLKLWRRLFDEWKTVIDMQEDNDSKIDKIDDFFDTFVRGMADRGWYKKLPERNEDEILAQFKTYKEIKTFLYSLPYEIRDAYKEDNYYGEFEVPFDDLNDIPVDKNFVGQFERTFFFRAFDAHDPEQAQIYFQLFKNCFGKDPGSATKYLKAINGYGRNHLLTWQAIEGFDKKLFPAIDNRDPQIEVLQNSERGWEIERGNLGLGDFTVHSYALEVNSKNINKLLMALREVPANNLSRLEQNRKDAIAIEQFFGLLKDYIHGEKPLVREVIRAMIKYYETKDNSELESLLPDTGFLNDQKNKDKIYNLSNYDRQALIDGENHERKVIDILKRLRDNTEVVDENPPVTSDKELDDVLIRIKDKGNDISSEVLKSAFDLINEKLEEMMQDKEVGIGPNMIMAIAWLERCGYDFLKKMTYEDQQGAHKASWFHSILRFQELTASLKQFNEEEFNGFISELSGLENSKDAYKFVANRMLINTKELAKVYSKTSKSFMVGALWSGNITHELIDMTDLKPATTAYGRRHRGEQEISVHLRNIGD